MKKYKYIDTFPKPFLEDLVNNRCLPFIGAGTKPLPTLFNLAMENQIINNEQYLNIRLWSDTRNKLVHTKSTVTANEAKKIVNGFYQILLLIG